MKDTGIDEPGQVILGPDLETRQFIASGSGLNFVDGRTRLLRASLDLWLCYHWACPHHLIKYVLEASAAEAEIPYGEFERIVEAAYRYTKRNSSLPPGIPAELRPLTCGGRSGL